MSYKFLSGSLAAIIAFAVCTPAFAQGYDARKPRVTVSTGPYPDIGRPYTVRVTTGSHANVGWERSLTNSDPNLKHWTWMPIASMDQAYIHVAPGAYMNPKPPQPGQPKLEAPQRPTSCYVKPIHVPLPNINYGAPATYHAPPPPPRPVVRTANNNLSGKVRLPHPSAPSNLIAETRSYGSSYGDVSGRIRPTYSAESSESRSVSGRLYTRR